jgi:4-hydroxy 2-oxovalerate aldolase
MKNIILLDCTLRDGGYYNNWDFSDALVKNYLQVMKSCSIDYVELGFRSLQRTPFKGALAFTTNNYLDKNIKTRNINLGVMINASEILKDYDTIVKSLKSLFPETSYNRKLNFVRIACHESEILKTSKICEFFKNRNIKVALNLMQISEVKNKNLNMITKELSKFNFDVFYIADSLGALENRDLIEKINIIKSLWNKDLGFHSHDNKELGISNMLCSIVHGVNWVDSTVLGMGRGPGNVKTELALLALAKFRKKKFDIVSLLDLIKLHFKPLKEMYNWGANPYYYYAAEKKIHPTFVQKLIGEEYSSNDLILKLEALSKRKIANKYCKNILDENYDYEFSQKNKNKFFIKSKIIRNRNILILGNGPGILKYKTSIESYILKNRPLVIGLNTEKTVNEKLINIRVACNNVRILSDYKFYKHLKKMFIIPYFEEFKHLFKTKNIKNFNYNSKALKFSFKKNYAESPYNLAISYAISICSCNKAKNIFLAGFDGYENNEKKNSQMNQMFKDYFKNNKAVGIKSITPTKYILETISVFDI